MGELIATRDAFGNALIACGGENKDIVVLDADLAKATMSVRFKEAYPERFFDVGIGRGTVHDRKDSLCMYICRICSGARL